MRSLDVDRTRFFQVAGAVLVWGLSLSAAKAAAPADSTDDIRRVVVIHFDTVRVDDIGCFGGRPRTPYIDGLAAKGMRYTNCIAPVPKTAPSCASFITGQLANRNGVYNWGNKLIDKHNTLAEVLHDNGFVTGGIVCNGTVAHMRESDETAGFDQGFDSFKHVGGRTCPEPVVSSGSCVPATEEAIRFIRDHRKDKFFLWLFYLDPHASYLPPPPFDTMYDDDSTLKANDQELAKKSIHKQAYQEGHFSSKWYISRHWGEVSHTDFWMGHVLEELRRLPGKTLLVFTADHGESLGEHKYWFGHGSNIHSPCVNVPLVMVCDGVIPVGSSNALVANIDIAPTILDLLGISPEPLAADGLSLRPTFDNAAPWPARIIPTQAYRGTRWRGARQGFESFQQQLNRETHKLLWEYFYDLRTDPLEAKNILTKVPKQAQKLRTYTKQYFSGRKTAREVDLSTNPEMAEQLRALGYLD